MPVHNNEIAEIFNEVADLLELKGDNPFRIRAYRNAAGLIESFPHKMSDLVKSDQDLTELQGVGKDLSEKIKEVVETGDLRFLEELKKTIPPDLMTLMKIPGMGAKKVKALYENLKIKSISDLEKAIEQQKVRKLAGFGAVSEKNISDALQRFKNREERTDRSTAEEIAESLVDYLEQDKKIKSIIVAGSFRRKRETVKDLDILTTCREGSEVMDWFLKFEDIRKVISKGKTRSSVVLRSGLQVDLRVVEESSYGSALLYFTGSKEHNIAIRKIAVDKKLKINEYGLFEVKGKKEGRQIAGRTEKEMYEKIGLAYIEPELRENRGEVEAARKKKLPKLITLKSIKGDLHSHTHLTDGHNSLEEMARAAKQLGYEYIANTEHSKHVTVAGGIDAKKLTAQIKKIDKLNKKLKGITFLKSIEVDILDDGSLDLPDSVLKELDLVVCAIHYKFNLSSEKQTERILRAMDNPYFNILAHPTGRLINEREPYELDMERIMKAAKERNCILELNAHPKRLDLNEIHCKMAKELGVKVAISTDSHSTGDLNLMSYGIDQARRGWLEPKDVINTWSLSELRKVIKRK